MSIEAKFCCVTLLTFVYNFFLILGGHFVFRLRVTSHSDFKEKILFVPGGSVHDIHPQKFTSFAKPTDHSATATFVFEKN